MKFSSTNAISSTEPRVTSQWLYTEWPEQVCKIVYYTISNEIDSSRRIAMKVFLFFFFFFQCSVECGLGMQSRRVFCEKNSEEECDPTSRPESSRSCSSNRTCSGQWFVGPWSEVRVLVIYFIFEIRLKSYKYFIEINNR